MGTLKSEAQAVEILAPTEEQGAQAKLGEQHAGNVFSVITASIFAGNLSGQTIEEKTTQILSTVQAHFRVE